MVEIRTGARIVAPSPEELDWEGEWVAERSYVTGDVVYRDGSSYRALQPSEGVDPLIDTTAWEYVARKGEKGDTGPQGPRGLPGAGQTMEIDFPIPATEWIGNHGLQAYPSITTVDTLGRVIHGEETYVDENTIRVRWFANGLPIAVSGRMILN